MIIAGTGHRPDKLGGYTEEVHEKLVALATDWLVENPLVTTVIAGGALGWDTTHRFLEVDVTLVVKK